MGSGSAERADPLAVFEGFPSCLRSPSSELVGSEVKRRIGNDFSINRFRETLAREEETRLGFTETSQMRERD